MRNISVFGVSHLFHSVLKVNIITAAFLSEKQRSPPEESDSGIQVDHVDDTLSSTLVVPTC